MIIDTVFVLALAVVFNGEMDTKASSFQTRGECIEARSRVLEAAQMMVGAQKGLQVYVSDCSAVTLPQVVQ